MTTSEAMDPRVGLLLGGSRPWWDILEKRFVPAHTIYIPYGCPDWGERGGKRNALCTFCALPNAVQAYRDAFYGGHAVPVGEELRLVRLALGALDLSDGHHTLMLFNAGSFLAMPSELQLGIISSVADRSEFVRVVIESRAELVTNERMEPISDILRRAGKRITVRIGVETKDDHLRLRVLRKGHKLSELVRATETLHACGAQVGGYALLNPAPGLSPEWAVQEAERTIDWILGMPPGGLSMDEAYFCSTNVGPGTPLEREWRAGKFFPATLSMVLEVLRCAIARYGSRVHLLPFSDEPELLAVPSNHVRQGIAQDLRDAVGCDAAFHSMFAAYRTTMDPRTLVLPSCDRASEHV